MCVKESSLKCTVFLRAREKDMASFKVQTLREGILKPYLIWLVRLAHPPETAAAPAEGT